MNQPAEAASATPVSQRRGLTLALAIDFFSLFPGYFILSIIWNSFVLQNGHPGGTGRGPQWEDYGSGAPLLLRCGPLGRSGHEGDGKFGESSHGTGAYAKECGAGPISVNDRKLRFCTRVSPYDVHLTPSPLCNLQLQYNNDLLGHLRTAEEKQLASQREVCNLFAACTRPVSHTLVCFYSHVCIWWGHVFSPSSPFSETHPHPTALTLSRGSNAIRYVFMPANSRVCLIAQAMDKQSALRAALAACDAARHEVCVPSHL